MKMTEMELDIFNQIFQFEGDAREVGLREALEEVDEYWSEYFNSCTMNEKTTGLEIIR